MKRILLINRSFWPDIEATGQFFTELCEELAKHYKITVIAGRSFHKEYDCFKGAALWRREEYKGIEIIRIRHTRFPKSNLIARFINWTTYGILSFLISLITREGLMVIGTDPPFLGIGAMVAGRLKSVPYLYNCRDLYPDVAFALGRLRKNSIRGKIFNLLNVKALSSARLVVCLGKSMQECLLARDIAAVCLKVIPDWVDTAQIRPVPKNANPMLEKFGLKNKFVIMYSGNIGLSHDFGAFLEALKEIKEEFALVVIGEGAGKEKLKLQIKALGLRNVLFLPYQPQNELSFSLSMADLHLVPLRKGMAGAIVPSKVYGIMGVARPYFAITDKESEPAQMAQEFGCGMWAAPDDVAGITDKLRWAFNHRAELENMGSIGRKLAEEKFEKSLIVNEWLKILNTT